MNAAARPEPRRGRTLKIAGIVIGLLLLAALVVTWQALKPKNFTPLLLEQIGRATGLQITARGQTEINWRGVPHIVLRDVDARQPGAARAVLTAARAKIAMPWLTLRSRGQDLVIERIELDSPVLDLQAFRTWQDSRPKTAARLPVIRRGIAVTGGRVLGEGWTVDRLALQVPAFAEGAPVQGLLSGQFSNTSLRMPFDLGVALTRPSNGAGFALNGSASLFSGDWALATRPRLRGVLSFDAGDVRLRGGTLGAFAEFRKGTQILPMQVGLHGDWLLNRAGLRLQPAAMALRGQGVVPTLDAQGHIHVGQALDVDLTGQLAQWPDAWPALPKPLDARNAPLEFNLTYAGELHFDAPMQLQAMRTGARFDGRFVLREMLDWGEANATGTPIPPMRGDFSAPRLELGDIHLQGVEITVED